MKTKTKDIALTALLGVSLVVGKLALWFVPFNIECVTFLIIVYTASLGFKKGGGAALIFALTDGLIYGYGYYTISYLIQYPAIAVVTALVSMKKVRSEYVYTAVAFVMVVFFGIHTTILDTIAFGATFWARYLSGLLFFAANILSACLLTLFAFKPLYRAIVKQSALYYQSKNPEDK